MSQYTAPIVFGKYPNDLTPAPATFFGQLGWWTVPLGWFCRRESNGNITASPNSDFSKPTYDVLVDISGTMVFFDCGRNTQSGYLGTGI